MVRTPVHLSAGQRRTRRLLATLAVLCLVAAGCSSTDASTSAASSAATRADEAPALFDETVVHEITVSFDQEQYDAMIDTFAETGEKEYIEATVTIDGVTYERAGLRLKGNSSLAGLGGGPGGGFPGGGPQRGQQPSSETTSGGPDRGASESASADAGDRSMRGRGGNGPDGVGPMGGATADEPEQLPWLIRRHDKVVEVPTHLARWLIIGGHVPTRQLGAPFRHQAELDPPSHLKLFIQAVPAYLFSHQAPQAARNRRHRLDGELWRLLHQLRQPFIV